MMLQPFSCLLYFTLTQQEIDELTAHLDNKQLTEKDLNKINHFYNNLISGGSLFYPEASKILKHYIHGNGSDLYIKSPYFFQSKTMKIILKQMTGDTYGPVTLRIKDDPRIAYAVNGFLLIKKDDEIYITQRIEFDHSASKGIYTSFPRINDKLIVPDRLIHAFKKKGGCKPFQVYIYKK